MVTDQSNYNDILQSRNGFNHCQRNDCFQRYHNNSDIIFLKTYRSKSLTATTIYENETRHSFRGLRRQTTMDNIVKDVEYKTEHRNNRKKQIYKSRKHHSDYDIVYLQVDSDGLDDSDSNDSMSTTDSCDGGARTKIEFKNFQAEERFRKTKSETNLSLPPSRPLSGGSSRTSSHIDITETKTYKEIYADNLRQYSFLLAKQLGTTQSSDALRKSYLKSRQKAIERRERANTASEPGSRKSSRQESPPSRKISTASRTSHGSLESLKSEKHATSLTDISTLINEKDLKRPTTVNRRKNKKSFDPTKRLSAPLLNSHILTEIENDIKNQQDMNSAQNEDSSRNSTSLSVPDLTQNEDAEEPTLRQRKISNETLRRQQEAKERLEYRMSRLTSFEDVLSQAGDLIKNYKRKASKQSQNNSQNNSKNNSKNNSASDLTKINEISAKDDKRKMTSDNNNPKSDCKSNSDGNNTAKDENNNTKHSYSNDTYSGNHESENFVSMQNEIMTSDITENNDIKSNTEAND